MPFIFLFAEPIVITHNETLSLGVALKTMIFAIYALGEDIDPQLDPYQNQLTPIFGLIMFALFHVVNITILISMLVAMLTTSFESIQAHSDVEWKFSRSRLYMEFIKVYFS